MHRANLDRTHEISADPAKESVVIVGRGANDNSDNARWTQIMKNLAGRIALGATILSLVTNGASAQERLDPAEVLSRIRQELQAYAEDANTRTAIQQREVQVFTALKDAADSLSGIQLKV